MKIFKNPLRKLMRQNSTPKFSPWNWISLICWFDAHQSVICSVLTIKYVILRTFFFFQGTNSEQSWRFFGERDGRVLTLVFREIEE